MYGTITNCKSDIPGEWDEDPQSERVWKTFGQFASSGCFDCGLRASPEMTNECNVEMTDEPLPASR